MNCPAWGEAELRDKLIWEELAETSHRAGSETVILCPAKTKEILLLNTVDKIRLPGENLVHQTDTKSFGNFRTDTYIQCRNQEAGLAVFKSSRRSS